MREFGAWIADCRLRQNANGLVYRCQAAVWANGDETARTRVKQHIQSIGFDSLQFDACLPILEYTASHPEQEHSAVSLARSVHAGTIVALSLLEEIADGVLPAGQDYVCVKTLGDLEPLDGQLGVYPKKTVPDSLREPLFGQPNPTPAEIEIYGSIDPVPPMRTYAIVSAETFQWQSSEIEACELPFRCLFQGKAAEERKDEAPYLIELAEDADFTRCLLTYNPGMPDTMTSVHLWHKEAGVFVRSRASLEEVWRHFRRFTRFRDMRGKWFHFRFWESAIFPAYWQHFSTSYVRVARFFASTDLKQSYQLSFIHAGVLTQVSPDLNALRKSEANVPAFGLDEEDHAFFQAHADRNLKEKVKARLRESLNNAPPEQQQSINLGVEGAFKYIKARNGGGNVNGEDCFMLAFLAILWGEQAGTILNGPLLNEPLLPISHRIALSRASYSETLTEISKEG